MAACSDDDDPLEADEQPVLDVELGEEPVCLLVTDDVPPEVDELPIIGCDVAHSHEIFATLEYAEKDVYPGEEELSAFAQEHCLGAFERFVGISAFDSSLSYTWLVPSLSGWNEEDDREVLCVLADREGGELVGSMRGSRRTDAPGATAPASTPGNTPAAAPGTSTATG